MKSITKAFLGAALAPLMVGAVAAQEATTPPVGYHTFEIPAGGSVWSTSLRAAIEAQGEGTVTTTGANSTVTLDNATFGDFTTAPHYLEVLSGPFTGMILDITANDGTTVTVDGDLSAFGFAANDPITFSVRAHRMLSDTFPAGLSASPFADSVTLFATDGSGAPSYLWDGAQWINSATFAAEDPIIYPNTGFVINAGSAFDVVLTGHVHWNLPQEQIAQAIVPIYGAAISIIGSSDPVVSTTAAPNTRPLSDFNLPDSLVAFADAVTQYGQDGLLNVIGTYLSDGTQMIDSATFAAVDPDIPIGLGFVINAGGGDNLVTFPSLVP